MDREGIIKIILGERYTEGREIADKVLDYVAKNPDWENPIREVSENDNATFLALEQAIGELYGSSSFIGNRCRRRKYVEVRQMAVHLYRKETAETWQKIGKAFCRHHSSVIYAYRTAESMLKFDKGFNDNYQQLKETFKNHLCRN